MRNTMDWETYRPNIIRLSLFRWRFEWALLAIAAVGLVLGEQAREARDRDPYLLVANGRTASANIDNARQETVTLAVRRGQPQVETRTYLDLSWFDQSHRRRQVIQYRLDPETVSALDIDVSQRRWPPYVNLQYLDKSEHPERLRGPTDTIPTGITSESYQSVCRPTEHCRMLVLLPRGKGSAEREADFVDTILVWGPRLLWVSLIAFFTLLILRFQGVLDNRPSLE